MERESSGGSAWELGATAGALRIDAAFAAGGVEQWSGVVGGRVAWRPVLQAAIGIEAWRGELDATAAPEEPGELGEPGAGPGTGVDLWGYGAHLRVTPWAGRGWPLDPALHFGIERLAVDDGEDRGPAFVAGAGLLRLAPRWALGVAVRTHHLSVGDRAVALDGGSPADAPADADLWEVRAELAIALGGGDG
jgi:hypothetical protein